MRVLHFGRFHSPHFGGLEHTVVLLLSRLKDKIAVANIVSNDAPRTETISFDGYSIHKAASFGLISSLPLSPTLPALARKLWRQHGYDIAHLHFPDPLAHLATFLLPRDAKIVISWHSDIVRQERLLKLYRPFLDRLVARAAAIIAATPNHFTSSSQLGSARPERLHVVPYGIDYAVFECTEKTAKSAEEIKRAHPGKRIVFAVGRHVYYKGFEYLIRAMRDIENAVLLLGGSGPLTNSLRELSSSLGLGDKVIFPGRIPDDTLPAWYHACDVFCLPSVEKSEAFGLVQLEAMACAKPIVGCDLQNGASYVNQHGVTGILVPPRDPQKLADALIDLLSDDAKRARIGNAAKARAMREFNLDAMAAGTLAVYEKVLARR